MKDPAFTADDVRVSVAHPEAFVGLEIFDDDGPEGYFARYHFRSSYQAAQFFIQNYDKDYHCTIYQINNKKEK